MKKSFGPILTELLWLAIAFIATLLICRFVFFWDFKHGTLDLHLYDTYFVFTAWTIIVPIFLLVTFVLYFIKQIRKGFNRTLPNIIVFVAGLLLIILLALIIKESIKLGISISGSRTIYPPLSALRHVEPGEVELNPFTIAVTNGLTVLQLLVTIALIYAAFRWGKQTHQSG